jgi:hypothetical protein
MLDYADSAKLVEIYCNRHTISSSGGLSDPVVATRISNLNTLLMIQKKYTKRPLLCSQELTLIWQWPGQPVW